MLRLYRGTGKYNKTNPNLYNTDGLLTKQVNSGDHPEPHKKYGWVKTITNHIHFKNDEEKFVYDTTQFLSFSSDKNVAMSFIGGKTNRPFESSDRASVEAFLFTAEIGRNDLMEIASGIFLYRYPCNYNKHLDDLKFSGGAAQFCKCNICSSNNSYIHKLLLIDAEKVLFDLQLDYPEEYQKALWDKEWLLMPADPMVDQYGVGFQSRIAIADFWTVDFYKYLQL